MREDTLLTQQLDEYRLVSFIKKGGMAGVYLGFDTHLQRHVAIKVMSRPLRTDEEYSRRFAQEAQTIAQLEHPNIVRMYRYGNVDGLLYMAMQLIEGADLSAVLTACRKQNELMPLADVAYVIRQLCIALDYAHGRGVIHRDVKPSNIMLNQEGQIFLTDFGISLFHKFGTLGEVFGTPHYISPEQAVSSRHAVPQSDFYSVGIMLYEMVTGQLPFNAIGPLVIAHMQMHEPPQPPSELRPALPAALDEVILTALIKDPAERYASGADLSQALDRALGIGTTDALLVPASQDLCQQIEQVAAPPAKTLPPPITPIAPVAKDAPTPTMAEPARTLNNDLPTPLPPLGSHRIAVAPKPRTHRRRRTLPAYTIIAGLLLLFLVSMAWALIRSPFGFRLGPVGDMLAAAQAGAVANAGIDTGQITTQSTPTVELATATATHTPLIAESTKPAPTITSPTITSPTITSPTITSTSTSLPTPLPTPLPTSSPTSSPTATHTATPTATETALPQPTATPAPTSTPEIISDAPEGAVVQLLLPIISRAVTPLDEHTRVRKIDFIGIIDQLPPVVSWEDGGWANNGPDDDDEKSRQDGANFRSEWLVTGTTVYIDANTKIKHASRGIHIGAKVIISGYMHADGRIEAITIEIQKEPKQQTPPQKNAGGKDD